MSLSKLSENCNIFDIRSTELNLWLMKDIHSNFGQIFTEFIAKQEIRMDCAWELDNPLYELLAIHTA